MVVGGGLHFLVQRRNERYVAGVAPVGRHLHILHREVADQEVKIVQLGLFHKLLGAVKVGHINHLQVDVGAVFALLVYGCEHSGIKVQEVGGRRGQLASDGDDKGNVGSAAERHEHRLPVPVLLGVFRVYYRDGRFALTLFLLFKQLVFRHLYHSVVVHFGVRFAAKGNPEHLPHDQGLGVEVVRSYDIFLRHLILEGQHQQGVVPFYAV